MKRLGRLVRVAIVAMGATASAHAQPAKGPDDLIEQGITLREQGRDEEALEVFRRADRERSTPRSRAQLALAEQALGIWVLAETHLTSALAESQDPWIAKHRAALDGALAIIRSHLGTLEVRSQVSGAEVFIDGARVGVVGGPTPFRVEVGARNVELRREGYHSSSRVAQITTGATTRETFSLVPKSEALSSVPTPVDGSAAFGTQRILGWSAVGLGAVGVGAGLTGLVLRERTVAAYNDDASCPGIGRPNQPAGCQDKVSTADSWQTVSIVGFISGGILLAGGAVLLLTAPSRTKTVACGWGIGSVACVGRF